MYIDKLSDIIYELSNTISYIEVLVDYCRYNDTSKEISTMTALLEHTCNECLRILEEMESMETVGKYTIS